MQIEHKDEMLHVLRDRSMLWPGNKVTNDSECGSLTKKTRFLRTQWSPEEKKITVSPKMLWNHAFLPKLKWSPRKHG